MKKTNKKFTAVFLSISMLIMSMLVFMFSGCKNTNGGSADGSDSPLGDDVVAAIGEETVSFTLYKAAYYSYVDYMAQLGGGISTESDLETFQDMILDYLVMDMMALYNAKLDGYELSESERNEAIKQAESELESVYEEYMTYAEQDHESDPAKSVEEYFNEYISALSEYYIGEKLDFDAYSERYTEEMILSYTIEGYKDFVCKDFVVAEEAVAEWYSEQFDVDKEAYTDNPSQYKYDAEYYELYGSTQYDACPQTYIPEGYSRIMDIVIYPEGELSDEYNEKLDRMEEIYDECSDLTFTDALNGNDANAERIAELLDEYRRLDEESSRLYDEFSSAARERIDAAYAELEAGASFADVVIKYTDDTDILNSEAMIAKGQLISLEYQCEYDWSNTVKEIFSMLEMGEYSSVFTDDDGSFHIIYYASDEKAGEVGLDALYDVIEEYVKEETDAAAWDELMETWLDDPNIVRNMELVRSVGREALEEDEEE